MSTESNHTIQATHLERDAYLYVRQSSLRQLIEHSESTKRQYALRDRAVALGWPLERIHTIDSDLGLSGASSTKRDGFKHLISEIALGKAGIVLGLEVSRLARNNADWHRLIELAALSRTLILDEDGIYDPGRFNDRLLLGLKGTMSEAELHVLKARLQGGIINKAQRGELKIPLPIGLVYRSDDRIIIDPDEQITQSIKFVFEQFRKLGTAMRVVKCFQKESINFPRRIRRGIGKGDVLWGPLNHSRVIQILHNPRYAGAFVYGRTRSVHTAELGVKTRKVSKKDWAIVIQDAHVGYISWDEFEHNQTTLRRNTIGFSKGERSSIPREGLALLQGRVICGLCGKRMRVRYQKVGEKQVPYYQCVEASVRIAGTLCQSIRGNAIDQAVSTLLLKTMQPKAINMALAVQDEIVQRINQTNTLRASQLERARYEAERARRRYMKVDPDNRLVADSLESDWNERLRHFNALQLEHEQQKKKDTLIFSGKSRERIIALTQDFPKIWNSTRTKALERKRILSLLIEDVTLTKKEEIAVDIRFRGGKTHSLTVKKPLPMARVRKTPVEVVNALNKLLDSYPERDATVQLNKMGYRNWQGQAFTRRKVDFIKYAYGLKSRYERLRARGLLRSEEIAKQLGVSITTVHTWGRKGILKREVYGTSRRCLYHPLDSSMLSRSKNSEICVGQLN